MGFIANIFGGGAARHAANVANVRAQTTAQQQIAAGQQMYNNITQEGAALNGQLLGQGQTAYNQLVGAIPGVTQPFQPMIQAGQAAAAQYQADLPQLTAQYAPTQAQLSATPGYQFALQQGLESTQNAAAANGLGVSGASLKAAGNYATGLAQQTYAQDAGIYQQGQQIAANNLLGGINAGTTAANASGSLASGLQQAATGTQQGYNTAAANTEQQSLATAAADYLNQTNSGASTSLAGDQTAASGQLAYNNALLGGIGTLTQGALGAITAYNSRLPSTPATTSSTPGVVSTPTYNALMPNTQTGAQPTAYGVKSNFYNSLQAPL